MARRAGLEVLSGLLLSLCLVLPDTSVAQQGLARTRAQFWSIAPEDYLQGAGDPFFPEASELPADRDIGVAFSGGGVRSAAATIGELRGLAETGLLGRVRYTSAVSGGSWSSIPWTYSGARNLLGEYRGPGALRFADVRTPNGRMVEALSDVSLLADEIKESVLQIWENNVPADSQQAARAARRLLGQAERPNEVYTTLLARNLVGNLVPGAGTSDFVWNAAQEAEMRARNPGVPFRVLQPQPDRPFMIVNANVLNVGRDLTYPGASPIEITPLYVGARQQIGGQFGGLYAWPVAYNAVTARIANGVAGFLDVTHDGEHPRITLADAAAASGAAPLYWVAGGNGLARDLRDLVATRGAAFFPSFTHLAMRDGQVLRPAASWPHADGGARDNLGVMALLARHVTRIIVFVNTSNPDFANNDDIRALFVEGSLTASGDKRGLVVLEGGAAAYDAVVDGFARARRDGRPLVTCGTFDVAGNRLFNVRPYAGASICWVYPDLATNWTNAIQDEQVKALVTGECETCEQDGRFSNFPWYATFFQNRNLKAPAQFGILKLTPAQVNVLADLMAWNVVESKAILERAFSD